MSVPQVIIVIADAVILLNLLMLPWGGLIEVLYSITAGFPFGRHVYEQPTIQSGYITIVPNVTAKGANGSTDTTTTTDGVCAISRESAAWAVPRVHQRVLFGSTRAYRDVWAVVANGSKARLNRHVTIYPPAYGRLGSIPEPLEARYRPGRNHRSSKEPR